MKLLLGTGNPGKIKHFKEFLADTDIELVTPQDLGITGEPEETGETIEENAIIKAKFYFEKSGLPTLADDAGFEIPALNNYPGTHSHRIDGEKATDQQIIDNIIKKMKELKGNDRAARMKVALALIFSKDDIKVETGEISGTVPEKPYGKIMPHHPYRTVLFLPQLNKWFYDLTEEEENQIGYRKGVLEKIIRYLVK